MIGLDAGAERREVTVVGDEPPGMTSGLARDVAVDILVNGAQPRSSLAERLGVSAATVTRLVRPLMDAGVLVESEQLRNPGRGRSAYALDVQPDRYRFVGVKITHDDLYGVLTDLRATVLHQLTMPLTSLEVPDVVTAVTRAVRELQDRGGRAVHAVGVTVGGTVIAGETVSDSPFLHWQDVPFRALLGDALGLPVHLDNDVVGLTKAQHWFGYGRGVPSFALLTIGAGIGYGLVVNDRMVPTSLSPMSHYPVQPGGPLCPMGHRGCMTSLLAADSIAAAVSVGRGSLVSFDEALELADHDDPVALRVVREAAYALGRAAAAISCMTGVERIVLSGEGVHLADVATGALDAGFHEFDVRPTPHSEIVLRPMDFDEWARGAAVVAIQAAFPPVARG
jgi:predicted NBD/HSP70 family sugar kinase